MKSSDQDGLEALATLANTCYASSMSEVWDKARRFVVLLPGWDKRIGAVAGLEQKITSASDISCSISVAALKPRLTKAWYLSI